MKTLISTGLFVAMLFCCVSTATSQDFINTTCHDMLVKVHYHDPGGLCGPATSCSDIGVNGGFLGSGATQTWWGPCADATVYSVACIDFSGGSPGIAYWYLAGCGTSTTAAFVSPCNMSTPNYGIIQAGSEFYIIEL